MASNLSTIGFGIADPQALQTLVLRLANEAATRLTCPHGDCLIWRSRTGAEIWFHLARAAEGEPEATREIVGLTPFFEGGSRVRVRITSRIVRPQDNAFEGAFCAWVQPPATTPDEAAAPSGADGLYPLVFDSLDYAVHANREQPFEGHARLVGFAREIRAYPDEAAFLEAQTGDNGFGPRAFVPVGLLAASQRDSDGRDGDSAATPSSNVLFSGQLRQHQQLTNEETGARFVWLIVETNGAVFDVVASPDVIAGELVEEGTVQVACWLFGRLLD